MEIADIDIRYSKRDARLCVSLVEALIYVCIAINYIGRVSSTNVYINVACNKINNFI